MSDYLERLEDNAQFSLGSYSMQRRCGSWIMLGYVAED